QRGGGGAMGGGLPGPPQGGMIGIPGGGPRRPGGGAMGMQGGRPGGGRPGGVRPGAGGAPMGIQGAVPQPGSVAVGKTGEDPKVKALDLIPATAVGFASVRVAEVLAEPDVKKALNDPLVREPWKQVEQLEKALGTSLSDVERLTVVGPEARPDQFGRPIVWA